MSAALMTSADERKGAHPGDAGSGRPMNIAFLSHTAMGGSFVVGSHHLAATLAKTGHHVTHISAPLSLAHLALLRDPFVRVRWRRWLGGGARINDVSDEVPLTMLPWAWARRSGLLKTAYSRWMLTDPFHGRGRLQLDRADVIVIDEPRFVGLLPPLNDQIVIYRPTDLYALMRRDPGIVDVERVLCARADLLIATSEGVASHLRGLSQRPVHVMNNGVDLQRFSSTMTARRIALPGQRGERAIYVGAFDSRFSVGALRAAALALPDRQFILAGPGSEQLTGIAPNVTTLGAVDYADLPGLLSQCAVGMLPFSDDALNAARSPMKLFEYAAAGLAIAASASLAHLTATMPTLCAAKDADTFADVVSQAFLVAEDEVRLTAGRARASDEGWHAKAERLLALVAQARFTSGDGSGEVRTGFGTRLPMSPLRSARTA